MKALFQHPSITVTFLFQTSEKTPTPPTFPKWPGDSGCVSPSASLPSRFLPSGSAARLASPPWHSYGQLTFETEGLKCGCACGSRVAHQVPTHVWYTDCCPVFVLVCTRSEERLCQSGVTQQYVSFQLRGELLLIWLFSTCCWSYCPCLSEQAQDNISFSTVAAGNWATLWLSGCDTKCAYLIYSGSPPYVLSVRTGGMCHLLGKGNVKNLLGNSKLCVTFNCSAGKSGIVCQFILMGAKWRQAGFLHLDLQREKVCRIWLWEKRWNCSFTMRN